MRDWVQWCADEVPDTVTDTTRRQAAATLQTQVANAADDTDWAMLGAQLALAVTVPRDLARLLAGIADRASFWDAAVRTIAVIEAPGELVFITSALKSLDAPSGQPSWMHEFLANTPGAPSSSLTAPQTSPTQPSWCSFHCFSEYSLHPSG